MKIEMRAQTYLRVIMPAEGPAALYIVNDSGETLACVTVKPNGDVTVFAPPERKVVQGEPA